MEPKNAIAIKSAYKHYGRGDKRLDVLRDLNMTVPKGAIYGLLGPSGCGKTTLLSSVIGQSKLSHGTVQIFDSNPEYSISRIPGPRVGYMPQETALCQELSIMETLQYFGRLNLMNEASIRIRCLFLISLLDLPEPKRVVANLSGGQKRRVSLAAALIHEPELLILDEPTVGVDPLLRECIWKHLLELSNECQTTIVITTHFIEETRQAHIVGMMRLGKILVEGKPSEILERYSKASLDEVFLHVCLGQDDLVSINRSNRSRATIESGLNHPEQVSLKENGQNPKDVPMTFQSKRQRKTRCCQSGMKFKRVKALTIKNFIKMWRNMGSVIFQLLIPAFQVALFCLAIGNIPRNLDIAIINQEISDSTCDYYSTACVLGERSDFIGGYDFQAQNRANLSCRFLSHLDQSVIRFKPFDSFESGLESTRTGDTWGLIHFKDNFSERFFDRFLALIESRSLNASQLAESDIQIKLDMTNQQVGITLQMELVEAFKRFSEDVISSCNISTKLASIPLRFSDPVYGKYKQTLTDFAVPGIILLVTYFMALGLTSLAFIVERNEGLLHRNWVAGVTPTELMLAHVLAQISVMAVQTILMLGYVIFIYQLPTAGSLACISGLTLLQGLCGMANGLLVSAISNTEEMGIYLCLATFFPNMTLSGIFWPLEGMPAWLHQIAVVLPQTYACEALRHVFFKGWGMEWVQVYRAFALSVAWTLAFLISSVFIFKVRR
uniref:ATP-binding cassette transporter sub-family H 55580 n=1 Tax=Tigriopus japonicus TaxID=158387 RepID=A0A0A7ARE9_TIGJA|nr:ATP-binding cassette transporter sub-family H 55580 [Tigriopus japonicus]